MKLLLCSDFKNVGIKYLGKFFNLSKKNKCLFIGYASEDFDYDLSYTSASMERIKSLGFDVVELKENYDFSDKIDMIFVRGGNTAKLLYLLRKFNQFEKIEKMVHDGTVYVGESAGSVLAGSDIEWTLRTEPYEVNLKEVFGKNAYNGFDFLHTLIFVHCSKYRFPYTDEVEGNKNVRLKNTQYYREYLNDRKLFDKSQFISLGNNQVYYENEENKKIITFDWSNIPVFK